MSTLVESLKRLYQAGRLTKEDIDARLAKKSINDEEYSYILS